MNNDLIAQHSVEINASAAQVWDVMTNPVKIARYLFGTQTTTDWVIGSPILFEGEYNGQEYKDKGNVLQNIPMHQLKYSYWTGFSGLPDEPQNYSTVEYRIDELDIDKVKFSWIQQGFSSEEGQCHSQEGLVNMLAQIKKIAEEN